MKIDAKAQNTLVKAVNHKVLYEIFHETSAKGMLNVLDAVYVRKIQ